MSMGLNSCDRNGCKNILCDTYIPDIGCVCNECQQEFKDKFVEKFGGYYMKHYEIMSNLKEFMETDKSIGNDSIINIQDFFNKYTS